MEENENLGFDAQEENTNDSAAQPQETAETPAEQPSEGDASEAAEAPAEQPSEGDASETASDEGEPPKGGKGKKTIAIVIAVVVIVLVAVIALVVAFTGEEDTVVESTTEADVTVELAEDESEETTTEAAEDETVSSSESTDTTTTGDSDDDTDDSSSSSSSSSTSTTLEGNYEIGNEVLEEGTEITDAAYDCIEAFFEGCFYLKGVMSDESSSQGVILAVADGDIEAIMDEGDIYFGMMLLDGVMYFINPETMLYIEFTEELQELLGMDVESLGLASFSSIFGNDTGEAVAKYSTTVDGEDAVCYVYENSNKTYFYFTGDDYGDLVEIDVYEDDVLVTALSIETFSTLIPSDMLNLSAYTLASSLYALIS